MKKGKRRIGDPWGLRHFSPRGEPRGLGILGASLPEEFLLSCWAWHNTLDDIPVPGEPIGSHQSTILPWIAIFFNSSGIGRRVGRRTSRYISWNRNVILYTGICGTFYSKVANLTDSSKDVLPF